MAIDVGAAASDRGSNTVYGYTYIGKDNPANASGTIVFVDIWAWLSITGCKVGTFYSTGGNDYKCRDVETIGDFTSGGVRTFSGLDMDIQTSDLIGTYFGAGNIERDTSGFADIGYISGDHCTVDDDSTYAIVGDDAISLFGFGLEADEFDIGAVASDRPSALSIIDYTLVSKDNPASDTGTIEGGHIWLLVAVGVGNVYVGTFSAVGNVLTCRDSESVGDVSSLGRQILSGLDIDVETGDYFGVHSKAGTDFRIEWDTAGFADIWYYSGESIDPTDSQTFGVLAGDAISLYGYGTVIAGAPVTVTPPTIALSDTQYVPVLEFGFPVPLLSLSDTQFAPVLQHTIPIPVLALSDTEYAPILQEVVTAGLLALSDTEYAPILREQLTPTTLALILTEYIPILRETVTPETLALLLAEYVPVLQEELTPTTLALILTEYAPISVEGASVTPETLALILSEFAPTPYGEWPPPARLTAARMAASRLTPSRLTLSRLGKRRLSP